MGSPARQKRPGLSFFAVFREGVGTHLSGFTGLSALPFLASGFVFLSGFALLGMKLLDIFGKFDVFKMKVSTTFSLENQ